MPDRFSPEDRSRLMSRVKGRDTKPELVVRKTLHAMGYRFRLQRRDLPGRPDIVLPRHRKAIFVHGCFWHGHPDCPRAKRPASNTDFWNQKLSRNIERDMRNLSDLERLGWQVLTVWECETRKPDFLRRKLEEFLA